MPPAYIKPYVKRGKMMRSMRRRSGEAMSRPDMRFMPIKSADQQAVLVLHKTTELLVKQRTVSVQCAARASLGVRPRRRQGHQPRRRLLERWPTAAELCRKRPERWRSCSASHLRRARSLDRRGGEKGSPPPTGGSPTRLSCSIGFPACCADRLGDRRQRPRPGGVQVRTRLRGLAGAGNAKQNSSGGKAKLGGITKQGNRYVHQDAGCRLPPRRCASPANAKAPWPTGSPRCERESRSAWSRWRSPTSWREFAGRS